MANSELGILSDSLQEASAAEIAATRFEENFERWHGPQPRTGTVVVYFAGTEGIMDTPDERPLVNEYMANMIA